MGKTEINKKQTERRCLMLRSVVPPTIKLIEYKVEISYCNTIQYIQTKQNFVKYNLHACRKCVLKKMSKNVKSYDFFYCV